MRFVIPFILATSAALVAATVAATILTAVPVPTIEAPPEEPTVEATGVLPIGGNAAPEPMPIHAVEPQQAERNDEPTDGGTQWQPPICGDSLGVWGTPDDMTIQPMWVGDEAPANLSTILLDALTSHYPAAWTWRALPTQTIESVEEGYDLAAQAPDHDGFRYAEGPIVIILTDRSIVDPSDSSISYDGWACRNTATLEWDTTCRDGMVAHEVGHLFGFQHEWGGFMEDTCHGDLTKRLRNELRNQAWS